MMSIVADANLRSRAPSGAAPQALHNQEIDCDVFRSVCILANQ